MPLAMNRYQLLCSSLAIGLLLFTLLTSPVDARKKKTKKTTEETPELPCTKEAEVDVDMVFGRMSGYGNVSRGFPIKESDLTEYCKGQLEDIKTLDSYAKRCKRGLPKQYFSIMLYTVKGSMNRICKKNSKKATQFLKAAPCIRRASPHFDACHRNLIHRLHKVKYTTSAKKIPYSCCEYYTLRKCFQEGGRKVKCSPSDMNTVEELMESTSSNALNYFCGEYAEENDKCDKLGPLSMPANAKKQPKFLRSISLTMAEIFDSFPEQSLNH